MSMEEIGGIKGEAQIDISQFEASLKALTTALNAFNQKTTETQNQLSRVEAGAKKAGDASTGFKLSIGNLIPQLTAANIATRAFYDGLHLLEAGFTEPTKQAAKFQQTMANVSSLIKGDATVQMKAFSVAVLEMSKIIPKDPNDLGAGLYEVVSANFTKTADALNILNIAAKGAVAGLTSTKTSVDAITTVLNAYQMQASQAQEVSDSLFVAVRDGKMSYEELAGSLGLVVSTAALAKVPLDQMNAALVSLTLAGQQSTHAATDLNMFLDSVIKASKGSNDASKMAKQLGIEYDTTALHAMGLAKFIQQVADKAGGSDVAIQTLTGDVRGFRALAVLAGSGMDSFNMALDDMANKTGTADTAFQRNTDTLNNDWILAWNNLNAILIDTGEQRLPGMQSAVDELTQTINDNKDAIEAAAGALSDQLVGGMNAVVENTPTIIAALGEIAKAAGLVASGIMGVLNFAHSVGAGITDVILNAQALGGSQDARNALALEEGGPKMFDQQEQMLYVKPGRNYTPALPMSRNVTPVTPTSASTPNNKDNPHAPNVGGGGGAKAESKALSDVKKVLEDIKKIEDDINKVQEEQIKQNKTRVDALRDELLLKEEMGTITTAERQTLDRINNRVDYEKEKIKATTQAWKDQVKVVEDLEKKVTDISKQIQDEYDSLQKNLKEIDKETAKNTTDEIGQMMADKKALEDKLIYREGLSEEEQAQLQKLKDDLAKAQGGATNQDAADQIAKLQGDKAMILQNGKPTAAGLAKVSDIDKQIAALNTTQDPYNEAAKLAKMSPLERIQYEGQQKKGEAAQASNEKTATLTDQLAQTNTDLGAAQDVLKGKINDVEAAQKAQQTTIAASYKTIELDTAAHVKAQVAQLDLERSHIDALAASYASVQAYITDPLNLNGGKAPPGHADGGLITGPGTGTSDSILARLSNGEYVMPARATSAYRPILDAMRSMRFSLPRFADGGMVTQHNEKSASITIQNYGEAAKMYTDPRRAKWHARTFFG